ncbi:ribulose-phosphate 3-epimerase [bacterium]|nr:ribulose-phosphate 3-epimerase [bacterium]
MSRVLIAPSILAADFSCLRDEITAVDAAGADMIHIDVMDGHFVPNISIGPAVIQKLRPHTGKPFDVHLMIAPVDPYLEEFAAAGADIITAHPEAGPHFHRTIQAVRKLGKRAGAALNPSTHESAIEYVLDDLDLVLVMSVNPGFGGQGFIDSQLRKIEALRRAIDRRGLSTILEVDGGVNEGNASTILAAGATALVAGSAIFSRGEARYAETIRALRGETV